MARSLDRKKFFRFSIVFLILAFILGILLNWFLNSDSSSSGENQEEEVELVEEFDPLEELKELKETDEILTNPKTLFVGDSITEGLSSYQLLEDQQVFAKKGFTVKKAFEALDGIVERNPDNIFILLGSNDLVYGMSSEDYAEQYQGFVEELQTRLPEASIYIQSIFPVTKKTEEKRPLMANDRIDDFNDQLKKTAKNLGVAFLDLTYLLKDDRNCLNDEYAADGIHLKYQSYQIWLDYFRPDLVETEEGEEDIENEDSKDVENIELSSQVSK